MNGNGAGFWGRYAARRVTGVSARDRSQPEGITGQNNSPIPLLSLAPLFLPQAQDLAAEPRRMRAPLVKGEQPGIPGSPGLPVGGGQIMTEQPDHGREIEDRANNAKVGCGHRTLTLNYWGWPGRLMPRPDLLPGVEAQGMGQVTPQSEGGATNGAIRRLGVTRPLEAHNDPGAVLFGVAMDRVNGGLQAALFTLVPKPGLLGGCRETSTGCCRRSRRIYRLCSLRGSPICQSSHIMAAR